MEKIKVYMRGWLNYYGIAYMKNNIESLNGCVSGNSGNCQRPGREN